jgi:hypothetical protein
MIRNAEKKLSFDSRQALSILPTDRASFSWLAAAYLCCLDRCCAKWNYLGVAFHPIQPMWRLDKPITVCWNHQSWPYREVASTKGQRIGLEKDGDKEMTFHSSWYWSHPSALVLSKQQYLGEKQFSINLRIFCLFQSHMERVNWERFKVPKFVILQYFS